MAIQKVNESLLPRGPIETMKRTAKESVKPEAPGTQQNEQLQRFREENKGFKIDTKA
jgi:hypothetical protein